jgi:segregation and condensation protein B
MSEGKEIQAVFEAILFVASEPVPRAKLLETFGDHDREAAEAALQAVIDRYSEPAQSATGEGSGRGIVIDEVAGGLRLVTRPDLHGHLRRFFEIGGANRLTMAALETLAIIAYRQPITGPEIAELRGVSASAVLKKLLERRLVRIAGRKEVVGKPFLYATTREFLMHFGLRSLKELPPLEQFEELFGSEAEGLPEPGAAADVAEQADREAARLDGQEDEAFERAEREEIEAERQEAEAAAALDESAEKQKRAPAVKPAAPQDPSAAAPAAAAEPASEDPVADPGKPSGDGEDEENGS